MPAKIPKPTILTADPPTKNGFLDVFGKSVKQNLSNLSSKQTQKTPSTETKQSNDVQKYLKDYLLAVEKTGCSSSTVRNYKSDINQFLDFLGSKDVNDLRNKPKLLAFAHYQRDKGLKENSVKRKLVSISQFKIWLKQQGQLSSEIPLSTVPANLQEKETKNDSEKAKEKRTEDKINIKNETRKAKRPHSRLMIVLNLLALLLFLGGLAYFAYQQFGQAIISMASPNTPVAPNRILSYQGRLTNTSQSPISAPTAMTYALYDADENGSLLWSSNTCTIDPDQDGIFNTNLGAGVGNGSDNEDCGGTIGEEVFTENANVWLEVAIGAETLTPRQPIRTVAYAINSSTLRGLAPAEVASNSTILMMNDSGEVVLGTDNPVVKTASTSSGMTIEANRITIQTRAGSNGDIVLAPDGTGMVDIQGDASVSGSSTLVGNVYLGSTNSLIFGGTTALGEISSPTDSGAYLIGAYDEFSNSNSTNVQGVLNDLDAAIVSAGTPKWSNLAAPTSNLSLNHSTYTTVFNWATGIGSNDLFSLTTDTNSDGTGSLLNLQTGTGSTVSPLRVRAGSTEALFVDNSGKVGIGTTNPTEKLTIQTGNILLSNDYSIAFGNTGNIITGSSATNHIRFNTNSTEKMRLDTNGNLGIGTTSPSYKLDVAGDINLTGALRVSGNTGTAGQVLTSTGTGVSWAAAGGSSNWQRTLGSLAPLNITDDVNLGATATSSALVHLPGTVDQDAWFNLGTGNVGMGTTSPTSLLTLKTVSSEESSPGAGVDYPATFALLDSTDTSSFEIRNSSASLYNTFIGKNSGARNTTGSKNIALGSGALSINTTGIENTAIGVNALSANTTGNLNVSVGRHSLYANTTGNDNSAIGTGSLVANTTGYGNAAVGRSSLQGNLSGYYNSAIGNYALSGNTTGNSNSAIGYNAGHYYNGTTGGLTSASNSLFLGTSTSALADGGTNEIVIGHNAIGNGSNSVTLGNDSITKTILKGNVGIGTTNPTAKLSFAADTTPAGGIDFGGDTNLYRVYANILQTDDEFWSTSKVGVNTAGASTIDVNTSSATAVESFRFLLNSTLKHQFGNYTGNNEFFIDSYNSSDVKKTSLTLNADSLLFNIDPNNEGWKLTFGGDTNLYRSTANQLKTDDNMFIDGNLGVGISPTYDLDVVGDINLTGALRANGDAGTSGYLLTSSGGGANTWTDPSTLGGGTQLWQENSGVLSPLIVDNDINLGATATASAIVHLPGRTNQDAWLNLGSGNFGIGTTAPSSKLDIQGTNTEATYGSNLLTNGDFSSGSLSSWTAGTGWSYSSGSALHTAGNTGTLSQNISVVSGTTYQIEWTDNQIGWDGSFTVSIGGVTSINYYPWDVGGATITAAGSTGTQAFTITPSSDYNSSIDNITVRIITAYPSAVAKILNSDGSTGIEFRAGGIWRANTFIGESAGSHNTSGTNNTAIGYQALLSNNSGNFNSALGTSALKYNTAGYENTGIGFEALKYNTTGYKNTANGSMALSANTTGNYNTALGNSALRRSTTANGNTAIGVDALAYNITGYYNTAIGPWALYANTTGYQNVAQGSDALQHNTSGYNNSAFGYQTIYHNTTGYNNLAQGTYALYDNTTGYKNVALGVSALENNTEGTANIAIGNEALYANTTAGYNTAIGTWALLSSTGWENVAIGAGALSTNTDGSNNTSVGTWSLGTNSTGSNNSALGYQSLNVNTTGYYNTGVGAYSLAVNTTGYNNAALGESALAANTSGYNNAALGVNAGRYITGGSTANTTSDTSIYLGHNTRALADGDTNEIVIGDTATGVGSNSVVLGNSSIATTVLRGNVGIGTTAPSAKLQVGGATSVISNDSGDITLDAASNNIALSGNNLINVNDGLFSGSVGIGSVSPDRKLEIVDGSNPQLRLTYTEGSIYSDFQMNANGDLLMNVDGVSNQLVLDDGGNVGVGLTNPDEKLTVNGSINAEKYYDYTNKVYFLDPAAASLGLKLAGNAEIGGTVTSQDLLSWTDNTYALGSSTNRWKDLFLGPSSLHISSTTGTSGVGGNYVDGSFGYSSNALTLSTAITGTVAGGGSINLQSGLASGNVTTAAFNFSTAADLGASDELLQIGDLGGTALTVLGNGNVGVGTTSPSSRLTIQASAANQAAFTIYDNTGASNFEIRSNTSTLYNTFVGRNSGGANTTGSNNSTVGTSALAANTTGYYNSAVGAAALFSNTTGNGNSALGYYALSANITGEYNSAVGVSALFNNTTGNWNAALGHAALYSNTTGNGNAGAGMYTLFNNTTGYSNSALGDFAGQSISGGTANQTSNNSLYLGYDARALANGDTNEIVIGANNTGFGSNTVSLGNSSIATTVLRGNVGIGTTAPTVRLDVNGIGQFSGATQIGLVAQGFYGDSSNIALRAYNSSASDIYFQTYGGAQSNMIIKNNGNVGIGTMSPTAKLEINMSNSSGWSGNLNAFRIYSPDTQFWLNVKTYVIGGGNVGYEFAPTINGTEYKAMTLQSTGYVTFYNGHNDLAENYMTTGKVLRGSLTSIGTTSPWTVIASDNNYTSLVGIVSTTPGAVMDADGGYSIGADTKPEYNNEKTPIAIAGTAPTLVTSQNGLINLGDAIGISTTPGFGAKMIKSGQTVGKALEEINTNSCQVVSSVDAIVWPEDDGKNSLKPCFRLPDGTYVGKIMVAVAPSWYDPAASLQVADLSLDQFGEVILTGNSADTYAVSTPVGLADRFSVFAGLASAQIKAGLLEAQELATQVLTATTATITNLTATVLHATTATIANLTATSLKTETITSSDGQLAIVADTQVSGDLAVQENLTVAQDLAVASDLTVSQDLAVTGQSKLGALIAQDATISGTLIAQQLLTETATVSGELTAEQIHANELEANSARINAIETKLATIENATIENATVSGTLYAENIETNSISANVISGLQERLSEQIAETLTQPTLLATLFEQKTTQTDEYLNQLSQEINGEASTSADIASSSATLAELDANSEDLTLIADNAFINQYFEVNGNAYIANSLKLGQNLMIGNDTILGTDYLSYSPTDETGVAISDFTFYIQPAGLGKISLLAGLMQLDGQGFVTISGDLKVAGVLEVADDLKVKGTLLTTLIGAENPGESIQVQLASVQTSTDSATIGGGDVQESNFEFVDENQTPVATFSANGDLALTGSLRLGQNASQTADATSESEQLTTGRSAGQATLPAGSTEVIIRSDKLEANSMIYVTPMNSTNNQVLYVKDKVIDDSSTDGDGGIDGDGSGRSFTVAIDSALEQDITFNWWLVQLN